MTDTSVTWKWLAGGAVGLLITVGGAWQAKQEARLTATEKMAAAVDRDVAVLKAEIQTEIKAIHSTLIEIDRKLDKLERVADRVRMGGYTLTTPPLSSQRDTRQGR